MVNVERSHCTPVYKIIAFDIESMLVIDCVENIGSVYPKILQIDSGQLCVSV
jgi:hypothetical protein